MRHWYAVILCQSETENLNYICADWFPSLWAWPFCLICINGRCFLIVCFFFCFCCLLLYSEIIFVCFSVCRREATNLHDLKEIWTDLHNLHSFAYICIHLHWWWEAGSVSGGRGWWFVFETCKWVWNKRNPSQRWRQHHVTLEMSCDRNPSPFYPPPPTHTRPHPPTPTSTYLHPFCNGYRIHFFPFFMGIIQMIEIIQILM